MTELTYRERSIVERQKVVVEARRWIGTKYVHNGDQWRYGVDCGMILIRVFENALGTKYEDPRPYPSDWMMHRDDERFVGIVLSCGTTEISDPAKPGDIIVFRHGRSFSHGGIITEGTRFVHAHAPTGCVLEDDLSLPTQFSGRPFRTFTLWPGA